MSPGALVLVDSSAVLALLSVRDGAHEDARAAYADLVRLGARLFQTNHLRVETHALLLARLGRRPAAEWLERRDPPALRAEAVDEARAEGILARYRDKDFSLCDAIAFAVMERVAARAAFTFDRHFAQYGFEVVPAARKRRR